MSLQQTQQQQQKARAAADAAKQWEQVMADRSKRRPGSAGNPIKLVGDETGAPSRGRPSQRLLAPPTQQPISRSAPAANGNLAVTPSTMPPLKTPSAHAVSFRDAIQSTNEALLSVPQFTDTQKSHIHIYAQWDEATFKSQCATYERKHLESLLQNLKHSSLNFETMTTTLDNSKVQLENALGHFNLSGLEAQSPVMYQEAEALKSRLQRATSSMNRRLENLKQAQQGTRKRTEVATAALEMRRRNEAAASLHAQSSAEYRVTPPRVLPPGRGPPQNVNPAALLTVPRPNTLSTAQRNRTRESSASPYGFRSTVPPAPGRVSSSAQNRQSMQQNPFPPSNSPQFFGVPVLGMHQATSSSHHHGVGNFSAYNPHVPAAFDSSYSTNLNSGQNAFPPDTASIDFLSSYAGSEDQGYQGFYPSTTGTTQPDASFSLGSAVHLTTSRSQSQGAETQSYASARKPHQTRTHVSSGFFPDNVGSGYQSFPGYQGFRDTGPQFDGRMITQSLNSPLHYHGAQQAANPTYIGVAPAATFGPLATFLEPPSNSARPAVMPASRPSSNARDNSELQQVDGWKCVEWGPRSEVNKTTLGSVINTLAWLQTPKQKSTRVAVQLKDWSSCQHKLQMLDQRLSEALVRIDVSPDFRLKTESRTAVNEKLLIVRELLGKTQAAISRLKTQTNN